MPYWRIAQCADGHLFETPFVPGVSLKALRLGGGRLQRCPVGKHWTTVRMVDQASVTAEQQEEARRHRTTPIP
ncbi:hypothetical protein [Actinomadura bangladeshensis]|uniref:Uncharacterized protein n=1 Tax=Actinomadura bangladeshensis TaxID=453573 RepID=A0A4R4PED8_9ACTN|nr:hypothetical protein [Actinomadura bangladeshensis]TDC20040.1 hypothetical protein E1284_01420 [Actinomadura bangladeshensis]